MAALGFPHAAKHTLFTSRSNTEINLDPFFPLSPHVCQFQSLGDSIPLSLILSFLPEKFTEHLMSGSSFAFRDSGNDIAYIHLRKQITDQ